MTHIFDQENISNDWEALIDRKIIKVSGSDCVTFLQRVLTANVETLMPDRVRQCALLSPQGKILYEFLISKYDGGLLIDIKSEFCQDLIKRLQMYKLRADVTFDMRDDLNIHVGSSGENSLLDERATMVGRRIYSPQKLNVTNNITHSYHKRRIASGIPEIGEDYTTGDVFAHEALLDILGGIDLKKGCYVGQEVVSRVQHRSTARKRFIRIIGKDHELPPLGTSILNNDKVIGTMGSSFKHIGLALVRTDKLDASSHLTSDGYVLKIADGQLSGISLAGDIANA